MSIDNKLSKERIKKALPPQTVIAVLVTVAILTTVFYITVQNRSKKEILIWYVSTNAEDTFSEKAFENLNEYGTQKGFDRILLTKRHPEDGYFDVLMSTTGYYTCDIFIMKEEVVKKYMEMDIFMTISSDFQSGKNFLYVENQAVGVQLDDEFYLLVNKKTNVDLKIIYDIFDILCENK